MASKSKSKSKSKLSKNLEKYEEIICDICKVSNLSSKLTKDEWDSCIGVAMVLAFMEGVHPNAQNFAKYFSIQISQVNDAYERLRDNGIFNEISDVQNDTVLKGGNKISHSRFIDPKHETVLAWAHIAGISSGHIGVRSEEDIAMTKIAN